MGLKRTLAFLGRACRDSHQPELRGPLCLETNEAVERLSWLAVGFFFVWAVVTKPISASHHVPVHDLSAYLPLPTGSMENTSHRPQCFALASTFRLRFNADTNLPWCDFSESSGKSRVSIYKNVHRDAYDDQRLNSTRSRLMEYS